MNENQFSPAQPHREDSFDIAVRGFNRQQVMEYMARSNQLLANLEQNLALARADVQRARSDAEHAEAEAERLRSLPPVETKAKPVHEEMSDRLSQILRLAAEEAEQDRANATAEITALRNESRAEAERMVNEARAEAERDLTEAREQAEQELNQAREAAAQALAEARETANQELLAAHAEADRLQSEAARRSEELINEAQRRAGAVDEMSDQRLETLTATHGEAVLRLGQIRDVLADLLDRDAAAGSLAQVVEAVMAPPESARAIDTRAELEDGRSGSIEEVPDDVYAASVEIQPEVQDEDDVEPPAHPDTVPNQRALIDDDRLAGPPPVVMELDPEQLERLSASSILTDSEPEPVNEPESVGEAESEPESELVAEPESQPEPVGEPESQVEAEDESEREAASEPVAPSGDEVTPVESESVGEPGDESRAEQAEQAERAQDDETKPVEGTADTAVQEAVVLDGETVDPDQTSVHEPIAPTAVHEAVQAEVLVEEGKGKPNGKTNGRSRTTART